MREITGLPSKKAGLNQNTQQYLPGVFIASVAPVTAVELTGAKGNITLYYFHCLIIVPVWKNGYRKQLLPPKIKIRRPSVPPSQQFRA